MTATRLPVLLTVAVVAGLLVASAGGATALGERTIESGETSEFALTVTGATNDSASTDSDATTDSDEADESESDETDESESDEAEESQPMGASVSAFMQSTAVDADESVSEGMFGAAYENAPNDTRPAIVADRTSELEDRLDELEAEYDELRENDTEQNTPGYNAQLTRLTVQIAALERAIDNTETRAIESGVDTGSLETLRANTSELSGPEIAAAARGLEGVEPPAGPPDDVPGQGADNGGPPADALEDGETPKDDDSDEAGGPPDTVPGLGHAENDSVDEVDEIDSDAPEEIETSDDAETDDS